MHELSFLREKSEKMNVGVQTALSTTTSLMTASESTASTRVREGGAVVRAAKLQDAVNIFELVNSLSGDGTLLRRNYAEI